MDISDFTKTTKYMPDDAFYFDEETNETKTAKVVETTWSHHNEKLSDFTFCLREDHEDYQNKVNGEEQRIMQKWFAELGYDSDIYMMRNWTVKEKYKIEDEEQIKNWLKPNAPDVVDPTEVEEI